MQEHTADAVLPVYDANGLSDSTKGLFLAVSSSVFIGSSFIIKKKGLRIAGAQGLRAGAGGYGYLREPVWWAGMSSMVIGELANFAAYAFAPAIIVTPLGALSIIVSATLAHLLLKEKLNLFGMVGCVLCVVGSFVIVMHAPVEKPISSVTQVTKLALQPGFMCYTFTAMVTVIWLVFWVAPVHGTTNLLVYIAVCSIMGSFTVTSCKALGVALKLTVEGHNQLFHIETWVCAAVVAFCVVTQMNYLNKALDIFNTAIVSPVYYVMFTVATILASLIMFQDPMTSKDLASAICGFVTIVGGTFLLHTTKDMDVTTSDVLALGRGLNGSSPQPVNGEDGRRGGEFNIEVGDQSHHQNVPLIPRRPK